jgi:hypothetical protein
MESCRRAGFADVRIRPLSYANAALDLTAGQWETWRQLAASKRPTRALRKIWRGMLELVGAGKKDVLFEEAFAMSLVRVLRHAMEDHPVIVASNTALGTGGAPTYRSRVELIEAPGAVRAGDAIRIRERATNAGSLAWETRERAEGGYVRLGVQLLDAERRLVSKDYHREFLAGPVSPGGAVDCEFRCPAPSSPGEYHLKLDVVVEGVTWMEVEGSEVAVARIRVDR